MAVDYTKTDTYQTYKNNATSNIKEANSNDRKSWGTGILNRALQGLSIGGTFGLGWWSLATGVTGALVGLAERNNYTEYYDNEIKSLNSDIATYTDAARTSQINRNSLISNMDYYIGQTRSSFETTYGKESFSMLESTIQAILDMDSTTQGQMKISELFEGLQQDKIIGEIQTRLLNTDLKTDAGKDIFGRIGYETLVAMNSKYIDISQLGNQYVEYLYNNIVNSDTDIGDTAKQISAQQEFSLAESDQEFASLVLSNQEKFAELFLSARNSNISNAQNLGETQASAGASGIKASKASRTSANAQKLQADITNASYAIMLNSYKKNLEASIKNGNLSRAQVYYSTQQQITSLKRQVNSQISESINTYFHTSATAGKEIADEERNVDTAMGTVKAATDVLKSHNETPNETVRYIYTTSSATK